MVQEGLKQSPLHRKGLTAWKVLDAIEALTDQGLQLADAARPATLRTISAILAVLTGPAFSNGTACCHCRIATTSLGTGWPAIHARRHQQGHSHRDPECRFHDTVNERQQSLFSLSHGSMPQLCTAQSSLV
jgi:hypothetical protein